MTYMKLIRANIEDCEKIHKMQTEAFSELLKKYQDYETSPAAETVEKVRSRLEDEFTYFYFIYSEDQLVGAIRVVDKKNGERKRISPIFIMKEFRGNRFAKQAISEAEAIHGKDMWKLDTILQEEGNCRLYEKLGYKRTGTIKKINERMDIVFYEKN